MKINKSYLPLLYSIIFIVLFNSIGSFLHFRLDLTSEKRYTLSEKTKKVLSELDDLIYIQVYLKGDFPSGFNGATHQVLEGVENQNNYHF